jgi:lipoyl-dependent peroxiredoxin
VVSQPRPALDGARDPTRGNDVAARTSSAEWRGDLKGGAGDLSLGSGAFKGEYSFVSRFEEGEGTNPEELIAAAHAACFSMSLSNMLAQDGTPATSVRTEATAHLETVDGAPTITRIVLTTVGEVPGVDEDQFLSKAKAAKENCPVSKLVTGATIELEASLAS